MNKHINVENINFRCSYNGICWANIEACMECPDYVCSYADIKEALTADVVEVPVRCKDCKHYCIDGLEQVFCLKGWGRFGTLKDDDFCSYGERKVNE